MGANDLSRALAFVLALYCVAFCLIGGAILFHHLIQGAFNRVGGDILGIVAFGFFGALMGALLQWRGDAE